MPLLARRAASATERTFVYFRMTMYMRPPCVSVPAPSIKAYRAAAGLGPTSWVIRVDFDISATCPVIGKSRTWFAPRLSTQWDASCDHGISGSSIQSWCRVGSRWSRSATPRSTSSNCRRPSADCPHTVSEISRKGAERAYLLNGAGRTAASDMVSSARP
jgi:hypothetical protein